MKISNVLTLLLYIDKDVLLSAMTNPFSKRKDIEKASVRFVK